MALTTNEVRRLLKNQPKASLGFFPTPLYKLEKLSGELDIELYIKRDDFTGSNLFGGNKTRKLEYLIGKAVAEGCDHVFTYGAVQSNHAMQTIWAAVKNGIKPVVYLAAVVPTDENDIRANLLLDRIYDAEIHIIQPGEHESFMDTEKRSFEIGRTHIKRLEAEGHKCMNIPVGGADETGSLGYIAGITELYEQAENMGIEFDCLYHATGSGGTMAGMMAGRNLLGRKTEIRSVSAMEIGPSYAKHSAALSNGALALLGRKPLVSAEDFNPDDNYYAPGYECPNEATTAAIKLLAKKEGILVDPVYSGKAFSALLDHVKTGEIARGSKVVFLHTGGATVFFAEKEIPGNIF